METTIFLIVSFQVALFLAIFGLLWCLHCNVGNIRQDVAGLRQDFKAGIAGLRRDFGRETADLRERVVQMEGMLGGVVPRPAEAQT